MDIKCKLIKELDNGSAIVSIEMDEEAKDWLIGEGFITVLKESLKNSKTYISEDDVKRLTAKKKPMTTKKVSKTKPKGKAPKIQPAPTKGKFSKTQITNAVKKARSGK
jgi:hypothetical protein